MSLSKGELFEKARTSSFKSDSSLLSLVIERKKLVLEDDVDAVPIDIFLTDFVKLAQKKWGGAVAIKGTWKGSLQSGYSQMQTFNIKANINAIFKTKKEQAIL